MRSATPNVIAAYQIHQVGETSHLQLVAKSKPSHWFASVSQTTGGRLFKVTDRLKPDPVHLANLQRILNLSLESFPTSDFYGLMTVLLRSVLAFRAHGFFILVSA